MGLPHKFVASGLLLVSLGFASFASAANLAASCIMEANNPNAEIEGINIDKMMPIASVSKLMTTWWAASTVGLDYRFPTKFHITKVGFNLYDVHVEGSRDPYFGTESLQFAVTELVEHKITHIRKFTFDENFKFLRRVTSEDVATNSHYVANSPLPSQVLQQLNTKNWFHDFATNRRIMQKVGLRVDQPKSFDIDQIAYLPKDDFHPKAGTVSWTMRSAPLQDLAKEMNRNSNNHAANQIFEHLGGAENFADFARQKLGLTEKDIRFVNGSGSPLDPTHSYNKATCSAMLKIIRDLREEMKNANEGLKNVVAVVGIDRTSTVNRMYNNSITNKSVAAKSGTVNPNITLAGLMTTKSGEYFFMYNFASTGSKSDARNARAKIGALLTQEIRKRGGGTAIHYRTKDFSSVDSGSDFTAEKVQLGTKN